LWRLRHAAGVTPRSDCGVIRSRYSFLRARGGARRRDADDHGEDAAERGDADIGTASAHGRGRKQDPASGAQRRGPGLARNAGISGASRDDADQGL